MELLNTKQAAEKLGVSVIRVRQLIRNGKIVAQNLGRDYAIAADSLDNVTTYGKAGRPPKAKDAESAEAGASDEAQPTTTATPVTIADAKATKPKAEKPKRTKKAASKIEK